VTSSYLSNLRDQVKLGLNKTESNGQDLPRAYSTYQSYTADILLAISSQALQGVEVTQTLPASSSFFVEVHSDETIRAFLNDYEYTPVGCVKGESCTATAFLGALEE